MLNVIIFNSLILAEDNFLIFFTFSLSTFFFVEHIENTREKKLRIFFNDFFFVDHIENQ